MEAVIQVHPLPYMCFEAAYYGIDCFQTAPVFNDYSVLSPTPEVSEIRL